MQDSYNSSYQFIALSSSIVVDFPFPFGIQLLKSFQLSAPEGFFSWSPDQELCPWTPLWAPPQTPDHQFTSASVEMKFWLRPWKLHKQTDRQTNRHYENNGHLAVNQQVFVWLPICALVAKVWPDKVVRWCPDGDFLASFWVCISSEPRAAHFRPAF